MSINTTQTTSNTLALPGDPTQEEQITGELLHKIDATIEQLWEVFVGMVELHKLQQELYDEFDPKLVSLTDTLRVAKDLIHKLLRVNSELLVLHDRQISAES